MINTLSIPFYIFFIILIVLVIKKWLSNKKEDKIRKIEDRKFLEEMKAHYPDLKKGLLNIAYKKINNEGLKEMLKILRALEMEASNGDKQAFYFFFWSIKEEKWIRAKLVGIHIGPLRHSYCFKTKGFFAGIKQYEEIFLYKLEPEENLANWKKSDKAISSNPWT